MTREDAIRLIALGLMEAGEYHSREAACEQAEELLDAYLLDPPYRVEGVEVPVEFISAAIENA